MADTVTKPISSQILNKGRGRRVQILTFSGEVFINDRWTMNGTNNVATLVRVNPTNLSNGFLPDRLESPADDVTGVIATGVLTLTGLPLNTETTVIGGKTYTWQDTLTDVDGNLLIAGSASLCLDTLIAAIELGAGADTLYALSMTTPGDVTVAAGAGDTMDVTSLSSFTYFNPISTTHTLTNFTFFYTTLTFFFYQFIPSHTNLHFTVPHST